MIQVVSFDIGGTLIKPSPGNSIVEMISQETGINLSVIKWKFKELFVEKRGDVHQFCSEIGFDQPAAIIRIIESGKNKSRASVFEDVIQSLHEIKNKGFHLVSISNKPYWNETNLNDYGLGALFDLEIYSGEIGYAKPKAEIFRHAEKMMKTTPDKMIHIGDSNSDIQGAQNAGWYSVLLCRNQNHVSIQLKNGVAPDYTISSMNELLPIIMQINNRDMKT